MTLPPQYVCSTFEELDVQVRGCLHPFSLVASPGVARRMLPARDSIRQPGRVNIKTRSSQLIFNPNPENRRQIAINPIKGRVCPRSSGGPVQVRRINYPPMSQKTRSTLFPNKGPVVGKSVYCFRKFDEKSDQVYKSCKCPGRVRYLLLSRTTQSRAASSCPRRAPSYELDQS